MKLTITRTAISLSAYRRISLFAIGLLASCSSDGLPALDPPDPDPLEIRLFSDIATIIAQTRGEGVITNARTTNLEVAFVRIDQGGSPAVYPAVYTGINKLPATITPGKGIEFSPTQYYLPNNDRTTKFYGWYPRTGDWSVSNVGAGTVTFAVDGSTDILMAQGVEGSKSNPFSTDDARKVRFSHALAKVEVRVKLGNEAYASLWGDISAIEFLGKQQQCVFTFPAPNTADPITTGFTGAGDLKMIAKDGTAAHGSIPLSTTIKTTETEVGYAMFAPHKNSTDKLQVRVTTTAGGTHILDIEKADAALSEGKSWTLKLEFKAKTIEPTAVITDWGTGGELPVSLGDK